MKNSDKSYSKIYEIYDFIREIGANFKMSEEEFKTKFQTFISHLGVDESLEEKVDCYYKRMFVMNIFVKLRPRLNQKEIL